MSTTESHSILSKPVFSDQKEQLPLLISPQTTGTADLSDLKSWLSTNRAEVLGHLRNHGAILLRGFPVRSAEDFESVIRRIDEDLKSDYLGTSPRENQTRHVFSASELPGFYPIMQHCEMSFLDYPPKKLFFFCEIAPRSGGETPITDFRKVYAEMDPEIRNEFDTRGIRIIRNYDGPDTPKGADLWKLKRWDEMFQTTDKSKAAEICRQNNFEWAWTGKDKLRITSYQEASRTHPETEIPAWFNHLQVFHASAARMEYSKIFARQKTPRSGFFYGLVSLMTWIKKISIKPEEQAMHTTFRDGSPIPDAYVRHVQDLIWKHIVFLKWEPGDVIAIDNFAVSHGRIPYRGPRKVFVAWTG